MDGNEFHSGETAIRWACRALLCGRIISHRTEIREARGWRLSAIVHRLRHEYGWPIPVEPRGPLGVAHYWLDPKCDRNRLRYPPSARNLEPGQ